MQFRPKFALMILAVIFAALCIMLVVALFMGGGDSGVDEDNSNVDSNTAHVVGVDHSSVGSWPDALGREDVDPVLAVRAGPGDVGEP